MIRLSDHLRLEFGEKIYRLSLSSGCTCPNRDGSLGYGGCTFCSEGGSGEFSAPFLPVDEQIRAAKERISKKTDAKRFIAYFQSFTNTYGDVGRLRRLYLETIRHDEIAALSLGTRPDCLGPEVMKMLLELQSVKPVWVELG
ncbi:MAG: TIGR01212 family radical SAM protein, partial [Lachnospiraceae bacterium]|nr:TIGR01212 family radical SAM protein [Lachnospiraceae bacterium]